MPDRPLITTEDERVGILVVDDDDVRQSAVRILAARGYDVASAVDGQEAYQYLASHGDQIDVVLSDMVTPGLSGAELAARIRVTSPETRLVFMSGYAPELLTIGRSLDAIPSVEKPFSADSLLDVVQATVDARPPGSH